MECHTSVSCGRGLGVYGIPHVCKLWLGFSVYGIPHVCGCGLWNATRL